jgi:hypothetical protein
LIRMILGLNTEKPKFLRDVQDVQKFALIRTGVKLALFALFLYGPYVPSNMSGHNKKFPYGTVRRRFLTVRRILLR